MNAYRQSVETVAESLASRLRDGLSDTEAKTRLERDGPNELAAEPPVPAWRRFLAQFQDVLVILLLIATAVSAGLWAYERDTALPYEALAILAQLGTADAAIEADLVFAGLIGMIDPPRAAFGSSDDSAA